jgi:hypothetical protein
MKSSENSPRNPARIARSSWQENGRLVDCTERMRKGLVNLMFALSMAKRQGGGWEMFASYTILTNAFRHRSLLALMDSQGSHGRSFGLLRPILLLVGDIGGRSVGTK